MTLDEKLASVLCAFFPPVLRKRLMPALYILANPALEGCVYTGSSGVGKSLALKIVANLLDADSRLLCCRIPASVTADQLLDSFDFEKSIASSRVCYKRGLLERNNRQVYLLDNFDLFTPECQRIIGQFCKSNRSYKRTEKSIVLAACTSEAFSHKQGISFENTKSSMSASSQSGKLPTLDGADNNIFDLFGIACYIKPIVMPDERCAVSRMLGSGGVTITPQSASYIISSVLQARKVCAHICFEKWVYELIAQLVERAACDGNSAESSVLEVLRVQCALAEILSIDHPLHKSDVYYAAYLALFHRMHTNIFDENLQVNLSSGNTSQSSKSTKTAEKDNKNLSTDNDTKTSHFTASNNLSNQLGTCSKSSNARTGSQPTNRANTSTSRNFWNVFTSSYPSAHNNANTDAYGKSSIMKQSKAAEHFESGTLNISGTNTCSEQSTDKLPPSTVAKHKELTTDSSTGASSETRTETGAVQGTSMAASTDSNYATGTGTDTGTGAGTGTEIDSNSHPANTTTTFQFFPSNNSEESQGDASTTEKHEGRCFEVADEQAHLYVAQTRARTSIRRKKNNSSFTSVRNTVRTSMQKSLHGHSIGLSSMPQASRHDISFAGTLRSAAVYQKSRHSERKSFASSHTLQLSLDVSNSKIDDSPALIVKSSDIRYHIRESKQPQLLVFLIDSSGSLGTQRRMSVVKGVVLSLLKDAYINHTLVALVAFRNQTAETLLEPTRSSTRALNVLTALRTGGKTPLNAALVQGVKVIDRFMKATPHVRAHLIIITDGKGNIACNGSCDREYIKAEYDSFVGSLAQRNDIHILCVDSEPPGVMRFARTERLARTLHAAYVHLDDFSLHTIRAL